MVGCGELVTLSARCRVRQELTQLSLIRNGAMLIRDGTIVRVGPQSEILMRGLRASTEGVDAGGRVVMPGFVDAHTHPGFDAELQIHREHPAFQPSSTQDLSDFFPPLRRKLREPSLSGRKQHTSARWHERS